MCRRFALAVLIFGSLISAGPGESLLEEKGDAGSVAYFMDNDLYAGTDRYYTHGGRIAWRSASRERTKLPGWAAMMAYGLPHRPLSDTAYQFGVSLNHEIYTPSELLIPTLQLDDRPYAGLLSLGFSIHSRNDNTLDSLEVAVGVVGPAALGEEAQSVVHRIQNIDEPEGWDNQLDNEPFINLYYQKKWRLQGKQSSNQSFSWDCIQQFGVSLGNVRTDANAGITFRFGRYLPHDFAEDRLSHTAYHHSDFGSLEEKLAAPSFRIYGFAGINGRLVLHDMTLEGNNFGESHGLDPSRFVAEAYVGFGLMVGDWKVTYSHTARTPEFEDQDGMHFFGALSCGHSF